MRCAMPTPDAQSILRRNAANADREIGYFVAQCNRRSAIHLEKK